MFSFEQLSKIVNYPPIGSLNDILVLEIGEHVSGPIAGEEFARKGALVIKIERNFGDPARKYMTKEIFASFNANKLSSCLSNEEYTSLLLIVDVIIDNRSPDAKKRDLILKKFLLNKNDKKPVIYCSIVGYDSSIYSSIALDVSVQAETGMAMTNAPSANYPLKVGFVVLDITTGIQAALEILSALYEVKKNKKQIENNGLKMIEVSMARMSAKLQTGPFLVCQTTGKDVLREGNRDPFVAPFSFYKTLNGFVSVGIVSDDQFYRFCKDVLNEADLAIKHHSNQLRLENIAEIDDIICLKFSQNKTDDIIKLCELANVTCNKVNTVSEALKHPMASSYFSRTKNNVTIISNVSKNIESNDVEFNNAPEHNEHSDSVNLLITGIQLLNKSSFKSLRKRVNSINSTIENETKVKITQSNNGFFTNSYCADDNLEIAPYQRITSRL